MTGKRKILIIGSAYPLRGGLSNYNERLAREYITQGCEVNIETFILQYPSLLFPGKSQYSSEPPPQDLNINAGINSIHPYTWMKAGARLRNTTPDLVIIKFWLPFMAPALGYIARRIRKNKHSRIISILDNIIPHEKRPGDRTLARYFINSVDGFVAMSKSVLHDLDIFTKDKPRAFCPHPLYDNFGKIISKEEAKAKLSLDPGVSYILFFGFIRDYRGLDLLIRAMDNKHLRDKNIKCIVAGEFYTDPKPYHELIRELHLEDRIIMSNDFIPDSQVANYFCASDMVVQPYKSATQSGVTQIAYHFNKPMIITNVGGLAEIVPNEKVGYVTDTNPEAIARAILKFYEGNKEAEFINNTIKEKSKYTWDRMTKTIDELLYLPENNI